MGASSEFTKICFVYTLRIVTFQKKSDALNISLVFDAHGIEDLVKGHGYHHPNKVTEPPKGLDSYPAIFSYPMVRNMREHGFEGE